MHRSYSLGIVLMSSLFAVPFNGHATAGPVGIFEDAVDIGGPPAAGSTTLDGSTYTLRGSGADIGDAGDQFHLAFRRVYGDFRATLRVTSRSTLPAGSGIRGRYGLMARWDLTPSSKHGIICNVLPTQEAPQGGAAPFYQFRTYHGLNDGNRIDYTADDGTFPVEGRQPSWMRLVRNGSTLYGYLAEDADQDGSPDRWCFVGSDSATDLPPSLLVGVALHSQSGANLGQIRFDNVSIEPLPMAMPLDCAEGAVVLQRDFAAGLGAGAHLAAPTSSYTPRVQAGRLRLTQDGILGTASAAWFDVAGTGALSAGGFVAEFDAFMAKAGDPASDLNPADGMTFTVVQAGQEILGSCPDRNDPRPARFTNSSVVWSGAGCAPGAAADVRGDLTPAQTSASGVVSEGDIWAGGDTFLYQYTSLSGDFDVAIEMTGYSHQTGQGRWGKFGLMARRTLDSTSRFTMLSAHGPGNEDTARVTSRFQHLDAGAVFESPLPTGPRPRFQRLTRRGNVIQAWVSDNPGLADGTLNPCNDCNWTPGHADDWGAGAPASLLVGFANSNHNSAFCTVQGVAYRGLPACRAGSAPASDLVGLGGGGLGYWGGTLRARSECHPNFAVEMDNWIGAGEIANEPFDGGAPTHDFNYHFGLDLNAEITSVLTNVEHGVPTALLPPIFGPAGIHVRVVYTPEGLVEAYARANTPPFAEYQVLSRRIEPLSGPLLFGFTAGTGGATATHEVDNLIVRGLSCTPAPMEHMTPRLIDLGNIVGGGDGLRTTTPRYSGVDPRDGSFESAGFEARIFDNDGSHTAPGPSPYIDSVFFLRSPTTITRSGVSFTPPAADVTGSAWNWILKDRVGGISTPGIRVGPATSFTTSLGIHSSMGVTFDLDALRAEHGASNVRCFSTVWGMDDCSTGDINLHAILSNDSGLITRRTFRALVGYSDVLQMPIPSGARYLTLATGSNGGDNCDHGVFARPLITGAPCPDYTGFSWLWTVVPGLVSTAGGQRVTFGGEDFAPIDTLRVGGRALGNLFYVTRELYSGTLPALEPGFHDAEVFNGDGNRTALLRKAVEAAPPLELYSVEPREVFRDQETQVTVRGAHFRPQTRVDVHVYPDDDALPLIAPVFVDTTTITGRVPALPAGQPPGFRKVSVDDSRGYAEIPLGIQYIDASGVRLAGVDPGLVSTLGGTRVVFTGEGFGPGLGVPRLGGLPLTDVTFTGSARLEGLSPALPAGFHAADLTRPGGGVLVTLPAAVEAAPPVTLTSMVPRDVFPDGTTQVTINGRNFRPSTRIQIGGRDLVAPVVAADGLTIGGTAPALGTGEALGLRDVVALDVRGNVTLAGGARYIAPPAVTISSVTPGLVSTAGGTTVTFGGSGFRNGVHVPRLGGKALRSVTFLSASQLRGVSPILPAGFHAADVIGPAGTPVATRAGAVEAAPPVTLSLVEPRTVLSNGTTRVTIRGAGFRSSTRIQIGTRDLVSPTVAGDGTSITGTAPALVPGELRGARDVTARDVRGDVSLPGGVSYVDPPTVAPGPEQMETSLAEGTARFRWHNPVSYTRILVTDTDDNPVAELPGGSTFFELPSFGRERVDLRFRGVINEDTTSPSNASAMLHECTRPAPLMWGGTPGNLDLTLYGQHEPTAVTRCVDGGGGVAGDPPARKPEGGGAAILSTAIGWVVQQEFATSALASLVQKPTQLVTGFTLDQAADKLEIGGVYEKLATAFDLELRCHLKHIYPDDGFEDEFTLPDVLINQGKKFNCITYFRADKDIGHPGDPDSPDPAMQPPNSCQLQIPAGEYSLTIYAVGGSPRLPYYNFADDPHDDEILIAGVPCPPYPLVKVTDLTGLRTLPDISDIEVQEETYLITLCKDGNIFRRLQALGIWLDESNQEHDIRNDSSPHFEYIWTVHDRTPPRTVTTGDRSFLNYCFKDWGCYQIDVRVRDLQCGFEKTRSIEVPIVPGPGETQCAAPVTFLYPTPEPTGIYALVGLNAPNAPLGQGSFQGTRKLEMRVLTVPQCYCGDSDPTDCPKATLGEIEFRLAFKTSNGGRQKVDGVNIQVKDLCPNVDYGATYYLVTVDDLGKIPLQPGWSEKTFNDVYVQGRKKPANNDPNVGWRDVGEGAAKPIRLGNRPRSLDSTFWSGHFIEGDQSYHFTSQSSRSPQAAVPIDDTNAIALPLPVDVQIPSYDNDLAAGFTARFATMSGIWFAETASGASSGRILGNEMSGTPVQVKPAQVGGGAIAGGLPSYQWCDHREIVNESFSQTLFESIIYTGTIGPVPVTIWASIGLGLDILVEAYTRVKVSPFAAIEGGNYAETDFYLLSTTELSIPCEIRADVLGGIVSIALRLVPAAEFILDTHIWSRNTDAQADLFVNATMDLLMEIEGCLNVLITEFCATVTIPVLEDEQLMDPVGTDPRPPLTCGGGAAAGLAGGERPQGGGAGVIQFELPYQSISAPVTVVSPDRMSRMEITFDEEGLSRIEINSDVAETPTAGLGQGDFLNPAATFVSNRGAIIAWTKSYCADSGLEQCTPTDLTPAPTLAQENLMHAQQEIVISVVTKTKPINPQEFPKWVLGDPIRIADPVAEAPGAASRRADGMATIAADLSTLVDDPPAGEALVAWVRYDGDYLVQDGTKEIYVNPCAQDDPPKACDFVTQVVPNIRPRMEMTGIYARRVSMGGVIGGEGKVKISPPGINVEPSIALSPSGNVGYCIWVHDPVHKNLIDTNKGRRLLYAVYSGASNAWSVSASVLPNIADYDAKYPGVLEPHISLKDEQTGLLVYTAVQAGAPDRDSGLGGSRFVYGVRLTDGVFGEPFLIHGRCLRRQYGWIPQVFYDIPDLVDPFSRFRWKQPEWVILFQGTGPIGELEGAGNVNISVIGQGVTEPSPAVGLLTDGNVRSNVTASLAGGVLRTLSLNSGPASISGIGGGAGVTRRRFFEAHEIPLEADLAVVACRLSDPFPAPGSHVTARVTVENGGFGGSPVDENGVSAVGIEAVFVADDESERVVATAEVPVLQPMERARLELALEMPHDPVRVRVRLNPNPIDRDRSNDGRECLFGAPAPRDLACSRDVASDEALTSLVVLTWTNAAVYDEVIIYKDGSMRASLPGSCERFVDLEPGVASTEYSVRGRMGASKSVYSRVICPGDGQPLFLRSDTDGNGTTNITDPIALLGYLFLGSREPGCHDAADADDNGALQITDALRVLNFLFLGGVEPAAPFPACGVDLTEPDELPCAEQEACTR